MHHVMAQNCGTLKGTTDLGIKFWANKVLALNWEDGAFSTSSSSWVCISMISSFGTCHRRVGMREFQLLRMTIWSTIVTSVFWPYFSELISWTRLFQSWWRYSCSCGMVPCEGWMEKWTKNCCKSRGRGKLQVHRFWVQHFTGYDRSADFFDSFWQSWRLLKWHFWLLTLKCTLTV